MANKHARTFLVPKGRPGHREMTLEDLAGEIEFRRRFASRRAVLGWAASAALLTTHGSRWLRTRRIQLGGAYKVENLKRDKH